MKKLSIIIPVYNEMQTVEELIKRVISTSIDNYKKEIIVVNDGSTDKTGEILKDLASKYKFVLISHKENFGKGAAIRTGLKKVRGDYVLIQDADLEYNPEDYEKLLSVLSEGSCDVVYGSRNLDSSLSKRGYTIYYLGGRFLTSFMNLIVGTRLTDINTCYKLFPVKIFRELDIQSRGFEFCEEVTVKTHMLGYNIKEVPIRYNPRKFSEGKKIRFWNAIVSLWTIIKYRLRG
jgi:dolichol-phosphate mannosyltransferase